MQSERNDSMVKKALESLCRNNGWTYGVFWRFDQINSLLLTLEDAFYEEHMDVFIDNMILQMHMLGNGIVGQVAFTKQHRWMLSDAHSGGQNPAASIENQDIFQDNSEIHHQLSSGIETVAVISVEPRGVVQFGSTQKIPESMEFVDQTKRLFKNVENGDMVILPDSMPSSSNSEIYDLSRLFASSPSSGNSYLGNLKPMHGGSSKYHVGSTCSLTDLPWLCPFTSDHNGTKNSFHLQNQSEKATTEAPFKSYSKSNSTTNFKNVQDSTFTSVHSIEGLFDNKRRSNSPRTFQAGDFTAALSKSCPLDYCSPWIDPLRKQCNDNTLSTTAMEVSSLSSRLDGAEILINNPVYNLANSMQTPTANTLCFDGIKKFLSDPIVEDDQFDSLEVDFEWGLEQDFLNDLLIPVTSGDDLDFSIASSSNSIASTSFEELSSASKRKESCSISGDQVHCFTGKMNSFWPMHDLGSSYYLEPKKEVIPRSRVDSWIGDSHSITAGSSVVSKPKRSEESVKIGRKWARPVSRTKNKENKERVRMRARIAELRELIPNSEKESGMVMRNNSSSSCFNDTRACEVGPQTEVDSVDVKDLSPPGQKLIKMLCEEKGFFLEIVDIIQGIGLTILKGVMELQENKIWARFIVEVENLPHSKHFLRNHQSSGVTLYNIMIVSAASSFKTDHKCLTGKQAHNERGNIRVPPSASIPEGPEPRLVVGSLTGSSACNLAVLGNQGQLSPSVQHAIPCDVRECNPPLAQVVKDIEDRTEPQQKTEREIIT
ncbi:hypothetical protein U1Q18_019824 [Sarracenia purpurea var. burkii]